MYNKYIDHTNLKANASIKDIEKLCDEAREYDFMSVCINPGFVRYAKALLAGSDVLVCTVIGFPLGANTIDTKVFEAENAIENGADELDMVINISKLKDGDYDYIQREIEAIVEVAEDRVVKVIIETCYLTEEEKIAACKIATKAGASFVKTSTGFGSGGATLEDVILMKNNVSPEVEVKASGGVRTLEDLENYIKAGATRIGTSSGVQLLKGVNDGNTSY